MITRPIPNNYQASRVLGHGLEILQERNGIVLIASTVLMNHKTLRQIVQRSIVGLSLPGRFDFDIYPLVAPTPAIAADVTPE